MVQPKDLSLGQELVISVANFSLKAKGSTTPVTPSEDNATTPIAKKTNAEVLASPGVWAYTANVPVNDAKTGIYEDGSIKLVVESGATSSGTFQLRYQPDYAVGTKYTVTFDAKVEGAEYFLFSKEYKKSTDWAQSEVLENGFIRITYTGTVDASSPFMIQVKNPESAFTLTVANFSIVQVTE